MSPEFVKSLDDPLPREFQRRQIGVAVHRTDPEHLAFCIASITLRRQRELLDNIHKASVAKRNGERWS